MSFGVRERSKEVRIDRNRHAESNSCGICGEEISSTQLFCVACRVNLSVEVHRDQYGRTLGS